MPRRRLVLASASPARLRQLTMAGFAPEVIVSGVDEDGLDHLSTSEQARVLAERKAEAVAARSEAADAIVVGCDSMLAFDGASLGKPASAEEAVLRWKTMRGNHGVLTTGHCVIDVRTGRRAADVAATVVRFGTPSDDEIAAYVASGEPLAVAGAFTLDGRSAPFVEGVEGDPGAVIGISLPLFRQLLAVVGISVVDLWD
ncbi:MAG TPA: Maf family protein [Acidimicrobiales bacterium]|nr:Maf family protein [Acidimicrobiales bacterium]